MQKVRFVQDQLSRFYFLFGKKKLHLSFTIFYFFLRSLMMIVFLVMGVCVFLYLFGKYLNFCLTDGIAIVTSQFKFIFQVGTICLVSTIHYREPPDLHNRDGILSFQFTFVSHANFEKNCFLGDSDLRIYILKKDQQNIWGLWCKQMLLTFRNSYSEVIDSLLMTKSFSTFLFGQKKT